MLKKPIELLWDVHCAACAIIMLGLTEELSVII